MEKNIKVTFTNEEVDEYINSLNNAKGSERKINKLLDLNHLPILVAYLRRIGVDEELLSLAAVVEFTRYRMRDVLTSSNVKEWNVTDTGVEFERYDIFPHPEKIGVDSINVFWIGKDKCFGRKYKEVEGELWPIDGYIYLKRKMYHSKDVDRPINRWGFAFCRFKCFGDFFIEDEIKDDENGVKYFYTTRSDTGIEEYTVKRVYTGEPINLEETENSLKDNYEMYSTLFPKYKEWLDGYYLGCENNLDERIRIIDSEFYKTRLIKICERNQELKEMIENEFEVYRSNKTKLEDLNEFLSAYDCVTDAGKSVIDDIRNSIDSKRVIDEESAASAIENCDIDIDVDEGELNGLSYEELKRRYDKVIDENDRLEEILEVLRNVNILDAKLVIEIEDKIMNIVRPREQEERSLSGVKIDRKRGNKDTRLDDFCY